MNFFWPRGIIICPTKIQKMAFYDFWTSSSYHHYHLYINLRFTVYALQFINYGEIIREINTRRWLVKTKKERKWSEEIETHFFLWVSSAISPRDKKKTETKNYSDNKWQIRKEIRKIKNKKIVSHQRVYLYTKIYEISREKPQIILQLAPVRC